MPPKSFYLYLILAFRMHQQLKILISECNNRKSSSFRELFPIIMNDMASKFGMQIVLCTVVEIVLEKDINQCHIKLEGFFEV